MISGKWVQFKMKGNKYMSRLIVINRLDLGSRELGWELWNGKEIVEMTSFQIKASIKADIKVCGLKIDDDGNLDLDREGFFTTNMMKHGHINCYKPMIIGKCHTSDFYVVTDKLENDGKTYYKLITSRFSHEVYDEERIKVLLNMGFITGGIKLEDDKLVMPSI